MTFVLIVAVWLVLCAVWPYWIASTEMRVGISNSFGPTCRTCRGTAKLSQSKNVSYEDVLARTCEGALLLAVHDMRRASGEAGGGFSLSGEWPSAEAVLPNKDLAEIVKPFVSHRRIPWLLTGIVRHCPIHKTWQEFLMLFGPPIVLSGIFGPVLVLFAA